MLKIKELLAKMLGQCEFKELIWTNPNKSLTSTHPGGDIDIAKNLEEYIGFEMVFRRYYERQEVVNAKYYRNQAIDSGMFVPVGSVDVSGNIKQASSALQVINYSRTFYRNGSNKIYISDCKRQTNGSAPVTGQDSGVLVPVFIFGIKFAGGVFLSKIIYFIGNITERWCCEC